MAKNGKEKKGKRMNVAAFRPRYDPNFPGPKSGYWVPNKENNVGCAYLKWKDQPDPKCKMCDAAAVLMATAPSGPYKLTEYVCSGYRHLHAY